MPIEDIRAGERFRAARDASQDRARSMVKRARGVWVSTLAVSCVIGCAQMLGLNSYRDAPEAGSSETGSSDVAPASDPGAEAWTDVATSADAATESQGQSGPDAADAPTEAIAGDGSDSVPPDSATEQQTSDAATDAAFDEQSSDSLADAKACPTECNGGCGNGGNVCTIVIRQPSTGPVVCPDGFGCQVQCHGNLVCVQAIVCPISQPCTVVCNGNQACDGIVVSGSSAASLCVDCSKGMSGGNAGCNSLTCTGTCSIRCQGTGCSSSCANCTAVSACP